MPLLTLQRAGIGTDLISSSTTIPKPTSTLHASPTSLRSLQVHSSPSIPGPHKHSTLPNPTASVSPSPTKHTNADSAIKQGLCESAVLRAPGSAPRRRRHPKSARVGDVTGAPPLSQEPSTPAPRSRSSVCQPAHRATSGTRNVCATNLDERGSSG